jgi:amino acid transporter
MNLVLTITSGVLMVVLLARFIAAAVRREDDEDEDEDTTFEDRTDRYSNRRVARRGVSWFIGIIGLIGTILLFIFTEDMRLPMEIVNRYTIIYVCVVLIELILLFLSPKKRQQRTRYQS